MSIYTIAWLASGNVYWFAHGILGLLLAWGVVLVADRLRVVVKAALLDYVQFRAALETQRQDADLLRLNVARARLALSDNRQKLLAAWDESIEAGQARIEERVTR